MWRTFLPEASIYGIDVNAESLSLEHECNMHVYLANQGDELAMQGVAKSIQKKNGLLDFIIDDGSHQMEHQNISCFKRYGHTSSQADSMLLKDLHAPQKRFKIHTGNLRQELGRGYNVQHFRKTNRAF